jgi:hypothetical protein
VKIVAFGHRQRVGKDTAVKLFLSYMRANYPKIKCERLGLFDWAKDLVRDVFSYAGVEDRIYYENHPHKKDEILPAIGKSVRQLWLEMGYYLREIHSGTIPENALKTIQPDTQIVAISDIRSVQDVTYVRNFEGMMVKIERDVPKLESLLDPARHPAYALDSSLETYNGWDLIINNNGTLRELNAQICDIAERMVHHGS